MKSGSENFNVIHSKLEYKDAIFALVQNGDIFLEKKFFVIEDFFLRRHRYCQNYCTSITFCEALVYSYEPSLSTLQCFLLTTEENLRPFVFSSRKVRNIYNFAHFQSLKTTVFTQKLLANILITTYF